MKIKNKKYIYIYGNSINFLYALGLAGAEGRQTATCINLPGEKKFYNFFSIFVFVKQMLCVYYDNLFLQCIVERERE